MYRQCKCTDCGYVFDYDEARRVRENHWLDGEYMGFETFVCCPNCGGNFEDASDCFECGEAFTDDELYEGFCTDCLARTINYGTFFDYCEANKAHQYLDIFVMNDLLGGMDCPENVSQDFHQLMIETYKRRVADARLLGGQFDFIKDCVRFIMEDDGASGRQNYAEWLNERGCA